ncbi:hypothetical protein, partial [Aeromonas dhakensis]|uniref:hypothetical protein n=1 Tax=Aeromonas dhakensis TaxID=196024 RepID=UPI003BA1EE1D
MALPLRSKQKGNSTGNCAEMAEFQAIKKPALMNGLLQFGCLAVSYSRMANATLPSALQRFTSE